MIKQIGTFLVFVLLASCTTGSYEISEEAQTKKLVKEDRPMTAEQSTIYGRRLGGLEGLSQNTQLAVGNSPQNLLFYLKTALPGYHIVPMDVGVDLNETYQMSIPSMPIADFVDYVSGLTGYEIRVKNRRVEVAAFVHKTWTMEVLANSRHLYQKTVARSGAGLPSADSQSQSSGGEKEEETTISRLETMTTGDSWLAAFESGRKMLGVEKEDEEGSSNQYQQSRDPVVALAGASGGEIDLGTLGADYDRLEKMRTFAPKPYITGDRASGLIQAGGPAYKIRQLDELFRGIQKKMSTNIHLQVYIMEVALTESKEKGIDWEAIYANTSGSEAYASQFTRAFTQTPAHDLFSFGASYQKDDEFSITAFVNFLETHGDVSIVSEPSSTSLHGVPLVFKSGDSIPVILELTSILGAEGLASSGGTISQMEIGVNMTATSWVMEDGRILVDVMPSISSQTGDTTFNIGGNTFDIPNIASTDLATRVVVDSGKPIILGGLTKHRLTERVDGVPVKNKTLKGILRAPFGNVNNSLQRSEMVIVLLPTVIEGSRKG